MFAAYSALSGLHTIESNSSLDLIKEQNKRRDQASLAKRLVKRLNIPSIRAAEPTI